MQEAWSRPPVGVFKLNVDGSYIAQTGSAGAGMILRRSDGSILFSACKVLHFCSSALDSELNACLEGVKMALQTCQENIMVEMDSLELLAMSRSKTRDCSSLGMLMEDLRILLPSDRIISFTKIPRLQNTSSHELARFSMLNNITEFW